MNNLQDATEKICDLKGSLVAIDALLTALLRELPSPLHDGLQRSFAGHAEVARTVMLHTSISEHTIVAFERDVQRFSSLLAVSPAAAVLAAQPAQPFPPLAPVAPG
jgi:hypothetical protein